MVISCKCPKCGSREISGDQFESYECLNCGHKWKQKEESPQEWLKRHDIPVEKWPEDYRTKKE